jgi:hypothetical protein
MILCDGRTLDPYALSDEQISSTQHVLPWEEPTKSYFSLWWNAISALCDGGTRYPQWLGPHIRPPQLEVYWYSNSEISELYHIDDDFPRYQVFCHISQSRSTRHGSQLKWCHQGDDGDYPRTHLASVEMVSNLWATSYSTAALSLKVPEPQTFAKILWSYDNPTLWNCDCINGDGEWIREGLLQGTISIAHDGSFMQEPLLLSTARQLISGQRYQ